MSASTGATATSTNAADAGAGSAQGQQGISVSTFFTSLVAGLAAFGVQIVLFLLIKGYFTRI